MNEVMNTTLHRHSIRRFVPKQTEGTTLQQILQAGLYAPSADGRQGVLFTVCQGKEVNERLGKTKWANSHPCTATETSFVPRGRPSIADDPELTNAFYDAPTVVAISVPKNFLFSAEDCALTAENIVLAVDTLGIGSCYIGQGWTAFDHPYGQKMLRQ